MILRDTKNARVNAQQLHKLYVERMFVIQNSKPAILNLNPEDVTATRPESSINHNLVREKEISFGNPYVIDTIP